MRYFLFILLVLTIPVQNFAQQPKFTDLNLSFEGKLLIVNDALIDQKGVLWICAEEGLFLWDGENIGKPGQSDQINSTITAIIETRDGRIIGGTEQGEIIQFNKYSKINGKANNGISKSPISCIKEDKLGRLLIGTKGSGMYVYDNNSFTNYTEGHGLNDNFIYCIEILDDNTILIGSDGGINFCELSTDRLTILKELTHKNGLNDNMVTELKISENKILCIGSQDFGFQLYDIPNKKFLDFKSELGTVTSIENIMNEQWIGFDNGLLIDLEYFPKFMTRKLMDKQDNRFQKIQKIINTNFYFQIIIANNRIYVTPGEWNEKINSPANNLKLKCLTATNNLLYAVYENGVYFKSRNEAWKKINLKSADINFNAISSMVIDSNGVIWLGSLNDGLICVEKDGQIHRIDLDPSNRDISVFTLTIINQRLFIGSMNGIYSMYWRNRSINLKMDPVNVSLEPTRGIYIYSIIGSEMDKLYFGTDGKGYGIWDQGKVNFYTGFNSSSDKSVLNMTATHQFNEIWFSVNDIGLYNTKNNSSTYMNNRYAFDKFHIYGMSSDNKDNLILIHENFLTIVNQEKRQQYKLQFANESKQAELNNNMVFKTPEYIYIGIEEGILSLQPKRFKFPEFIQTTITDKYLFLNKIDSNHSLSFSHKEHDISFKCYFPWFENPSQVKYEYFLEGYSIDTSISSERLISYLNLQPGDYVFHVRGKVEGNILNTPWTSSRFQIRKAWYNSYYFYIFVILCVLILFYVFLRLRIKRFNKIAEAKTLNLKQEIRILNSQINPHFLFNSFSSLLGLIEHDSKKAIEYTENLAEFYRNIVRYKDADSITLETDLSIFETYIKLQNIRFNETIKLYVSEEVRNIKKNIPPMTLQLLAENAIKHNKFDAIHPLMITIVLKGDIIYFSNNLSLKTTREKSTNSGLNFVKDRIFITTGKEFEIEKTSEYYIVKIPLA